MAELRTSAPAVPIILVGTKCDFRKNGVDESNLVSTSEGNAMQ